MRAFLVSLAFCAAIAAFTPPETTFVGQPIPFSHKQHAEAARLQCADCHKLADSGEVVSIPTGQGCMSCHAQIAKTSSSIKDLKAYVDDKEPVPWVRVYEIPSFVNFNHKTHLDAGSNCGTCHGAVATRDHLWRETDLSMGGCVNCHRATNANTSCNTCHHLEN